jgi:hypothetical protein
LRIIIASINVSLVVRVPDIGQIYAVARLQVGVVKQLASTLLLVLILLLIVRAAIAGCVYHPGWHHGMTVCSGGGYFRPHYYAPPSESEPASTDAEQEQERAEAQRQAQEAAQQQEIARREDARRQEEARREAVAAAARQEQIRREAAAREEEAREEAARRTAALIAAYSAPIEPLLASATRDAERRVAVSLNALPFAAQAVTGIDGINVPVPHIHEASGIHVWQIKEWTNHKIDDLRAWAGDPEHRDWLDEAALLAGAPFAAESGLEIFAAAFEPTPTHAVRLLATDYAEDKATEKAENYVLGQSAPPSPANLKQWVERQFTAAAGFDAVDPPFDPSAGR